MLVTCFSVVILILVLLLALERRRSIRTRSVECQAVAGFLCDFNCVFSAIQGYIGISIEYLERSQVNEVHDNLLKTPELLARMQQIIWQLKIAFTSSISVQVTPVFIQAILDEVLNTLSPRLENTQVIRDLSEEVFILGDMIRFKTLSPRLENIQVIRDRSSEEVFVLGDMARLLQIFHNIISRAMQGMQYSDIRILTIHIDATPNKVSVNFRDTGDRIPKKDLPHVFEPFFPTRGICDLELSNCYSIVKALKGRLKVANHIDGGVIFTVELPRTMPEK